MATGPILLSPPGARLRCGLNDHIDNESAYYLLNHPKLRWVPTNSTKLMEVPNTIKLDGGEHFKFMFGRVFYDGAFRVGKLHAGPNAFNIWIEDKKGEESGFAQEFQVLTCAP